MLAVILAGCEAVSTPITEGVRPVNVDALSLSVSLRADPMMNAVANRYPIQWASLIRRLDASIEQKGSPKERDELIVAFRATLAPKLRALAARMPDALLPVFFAVKADTYAYHADRFPDKCEQAMHAGRSGRAAMQQLFRALPASIRKRHVDIMVRIIRETPHEGPQPSVRLPVADPRIDAALWTDPVPANACKAFAARIKRLESLPPPVAARVYRSLLPGVVPTIYRKPARVRVLADRQTVAVTGRLGIGTSERLQSVLQRLSRPMTVLLNSEGGLLSEGQQLARTIAQRELDTRVEDSCASACTVAFLAGRQRIANPDAMIGFHQAGTIRADGAANYLYRSVADYRRLYNQDAMTDDFLAKVASTPSAELWYPTQADLFRNGIITDAPISDATRSGAHPQASSARTTLNRERVARRLLALAPVQAFATRFPNEWQEEKRRLGQLIQRGVESEKLGRFALARVFGRYQTLKPYARDELVIDAVRYLYQRMNNALNRGQASTRICSFQFLDSSDTGDQNWQQAILAGVIATAEPRTVSSARDGQWRGPWKKMREQTSDRHWRIAWSGADSQASAIAQCQARSAVLKALLALPAQQTSGVARRLWNDWM